MRGRDRRQLEGQWLPIRVDHSVQQKSGAKAPKSKGQRMGIIAPVRPVKCDAMPLNASTAKKLIKAKSVTFYDNITVLSKMCSVFSQSEVRRHAARAESNRVN